MSLAAPRLSNATLARATSLAGLGYDRSTVQIGLAHIGVGNFHRAHQAVYTDDLLRAGHSQWGILGVSLASPRALEQLNPQDGLYALGILAAGESSYRIVGALQQVTDGSSATDKLVQRLADPRIQVISMTVTEKAYRDTTSRLPGLLVEVLQARCARGAPLTLLSCDNLSGNGDVLRQLVMDRTSAQHPETARWIETNVGFPNSMVDRIAPQTGAADIAQFTERYGLHDAGHVVCEPFSQWVIEDQFAAERPPWDTVGAQFVSNVSVYEQTKLRLLNGTHSACAYLGALLGLEYVHEVVSHPTLRSFLRRLALEEVAAVTHTPDDMDAVSYVDSVLERFANSAVPYRNRQVASDGSQKIPQRWVGVLLQGQARDLAQERLTFAASCWVEHLNNPAPDPLAEHLKRLYDAHRSAESLVSAVLAETDVFGAELGASQAFAKQLIEGVRAVRSVGAQARAAQLA